MRGYRPVGQYHPLTLVPSPPWAEQCQREPHAGHPSRFPTWPHSPCADNSQAKKKVINKSAGFPTSKTSSPPSRLPPCSWVSIALVPWVCLHMPGTSIPLLRDQHGPDWVADAEIRPRRGKPPKPGSYTAWFPWQPSHSRQTVQGGGRGGGNSSSRHSQGWLRPQFSCWRNFSL